MFSHTMDFLPISAYMKIPIAFSSIFKKSGILLQINKPFDQMKY